MVYATWIVIQGTSIFVIRIIEIPNINFLKCSEPSFFSIKNKIKIGI